MTATPHARAFDQDTYVLRRKFFKIFGAAFQIYDSAGLVVLSSKQRAFKLKEDIRVYAGQDEEDELLTIKARSWLDFAAAYDIVDSHSGETVGGLKRKGFKSLLKDEWIIMGRDDQDIGVIREDNLVLAAIRRFVPYGTLIPQKFVCNLAGQPVAEFRQHFNPLIQKVTMDFTLDPANSLDRRLGIAAGILLCAIEERQSDGLSIDI